ncbi:MAG: aldo/keto reductase [Pseudotabrizicola sp.]|uniref:aldo/keto reductase n=1 Tax=Pseudotabrizicola sp. TaxID=2939647 RepID=UPI00271AC8C4|nr:aldo/keto reductase [Pseudotabrizicola sp.]MDO8885249.1 aldo/keto reductase [Pseudotabrizicola sp.]MDP2083131.1 aldo/keto reductase [Pseudotabrizicola sp.]MDZ7572549.1 aldo/keto reductase [Pseudotabrizicola sp.]
MQTRNFGRTGRTTTPIGFGAWAIGGTWGEVTWDDAKATLNAALDAGMTFIDTADVYGDGRSEQIIAEVLGARGGNRPFVATKAGRRLNPHTAEAYTGAAIEAFIDRSLKNLGVECLDLVQLHCPPTPVYSDPAMFAALDAIKAKGKIANYGVSVETVAEAMAAIQNPGVVSVQIIYNMFRMKPADAFFAQARAQNVAVVARVPLASGLLTGKMTTDSTFAADDHRSFNRNGEAFDKGETFSGVPFDVALDAVEALRPLIPQGTPMAAFALRWIMMEQAVTVVIPGAKTPAQAQANAAAADLPGLSADQMRAVRDVYDRLIAPHVAHLW